MKDFQQQGGLLADLDEIGGQCSEDRVSATYSDILDCHRNVNKKLKCKSIK